MEQHTMERQDKESPVDQDEHGEMDERRLLRRIDCRLIVTVSAMYCTSLMDRVNLSVAIVAGMKQDLRLDGYKYNIANLVFFFPYIVFQPPSTVLVRRIGPRLHLGTITLLWGAATMGTGLVGDFGQLAGLRAVLGLLEAGFFPSCVYLLSTWYTRYEIGRRYSLFYVIGCFAAACSGILAYGLMQLEGRAGLVGWRWIFVVEGAITCAMAVASFWLLVDFPDSPRASWRFLSARERRWVMDRIQRDRGDSHVPAFDLRRFLACGADWRIWAYAGIFFNTSTVSYALAYTMPTIFVQSMHFSVGVSLCLVAPIYAAAGIIMYLAGHLSDRYRLRGPVLVANMVACLVGLPIMGWHRSPGVRLFGVFLVCVGTSANVPAIMALQANNVRGQWKRAFCSATLVGFGGIGGIAGSLIFRDEDRASGYKPGIYACIACSLINLLLVILLDLDFYRQNKLADRRGKILEPDADGADCGFRYTY